MPTPPSLDQLLDVAGQHARAVVIGLQQQMMPLFHLFDAEGQGYLVAGEFTGGTNDEITQSKDAVAAFVRSLIVEHKIVRYSFLSEVWMIVRPREWEEGMSPGPTEADDRVEAVLRHRHRWRRLPDAPLAHQTGRREGRRSRA